MGALRRYGDCISIFQLNYIINISTFVCRYELNTANGPYKLIDEFVDINEVRRVVGVFADIKDTVPATGVKGDLSFDATYLYVCTGENTWKRIA